ncbi:MAG: carboxypeptidase regulatory-like domain-containing protein [Armatimonadota bacterium]
MKRGPSVQLGRALALFIAALLFSGILICASAAQTAGRGGRGPAAPVRGRGDKPLSSYELSNLPLQRYSQKEFDALLASKQAELEGKIRPANVQPPETQPQFIDLTTLPRPPLVGPSTKSQEVHPFWSWDQQYIFFASNNIDAVAEHGKTAPPGNAPYHIYRMTSDGAFIQRITGVNANYPDEAPNSQLFPALSFGQTLMAYVSRASLAEPYQLFVLDFLTGQRRQYTGINVLNNPLAAEIVNVERPTFEAGDGHIYFAARDRRVANDVRNVYKVNLISGVVTKVTNGTPANGVEFIDPFVDPNSTAANPRIIVAANSAGVAGGQVNLAAPTAVTDHNLFYILPLTGAAFQVTTSTADDVEPAINLGSAGFSGWVAWASKNRNGGITYDIYFNNGQQESAFNVPIRLFTPDTNAGAVPLNQTDERFPTWSAGLPPQNPIDRIAFQSNRYNNVNDLQAPLVAPAGDTDIWAAEVTDITPPTLFPIGDEKASYIDAGVETGETLHIANAPLPNPGRRLGTAGDTFYFYAKVKDLQYGVESVWIQIKDPDGPSTDARGINHKLYGVGSFPSPTRTRLNNTYPATFNNNAPVHWLHQAFETDYDGVGVSDYQYFRQPVVDDFVALSRARYASYNPGVDDAVRWSGVFNQPPVDANGNARWLKLEDDGRAPDQVAGDGIFSASWVTPNDPSDYYVDLIAYDKAENPQNPTFKHNWIIYDNIWGFSTQPFVSTNPVLYVDDYGPGQKWPRGLKGAFRPFAEFRYGTESEVIDRDLTYYTREVRHTQVDANGNPLPPYDLFDIADPGATAFEVTNQVHPFLAGAATPYRRIQYVGGVENRGYLSIYTYDFWRVLAKGAVPETVFNSYLPTFDEQPRTITGSVTEQQPVPRRAIVWNSPYTGDIFMGSGSILDQATQQEITKYRNRGGRLVIAGGDIVWALTVNGQVQQQFVQDVLGVNFLADETYGNFQAFNLGGPLAQAIIMDAADQNFRPGVGPPWWTGIYQPAILGTPTSWYATVPNPFFNGFSHDSHTATDSTPFRTQDAIQARAGWEEIAPQRMVARDDAGSRSKTVFMSFSLASFGRRYSAPDEDGALVSMNYRQKVSHAMFCWMFSVDLVGQVRNLSGGAPIAGAFVKAMRGNTIVGSAFTRADGTYAIRGLPVGGWNITVENPGFLAFQKSTGNGAHGLDQVSEDVFLTPAAPGSISGKVTDQFNRPVPDVKILATLQASPLYTGQREFRATTVADGTYNIPSAPVGTYEVTIEDPLPERFGFINGTRPTRTEVVNPAQATPNVDFQIEGQSGPLTVKVFEAKPDGTKGNPVEGAEVTILDPNGAVIAGLTGTTGADGEVLFSADDPNADVAQNVPAGPNQVTAFKFGRQEGVAQVNIPQQSSVEILLAAAERVDIYGRALRKIDNVELQTRDLEVPVTLQLLRRSSQLAVGLNTNVFAPGLDVPVRHNYKFADAQEGEFTIALRNHPRFKDAQVNVDVTGDPPITAPVLLLEGKDGKLSGRVLEDPGNGQIRPLEGATVVVTSERLQPGVAIVTVLTGADGTYATPTIPSDVYTVTVRKFGHTERTISGVFVAGDTTLDDIVLIRAARGQVFGLTRRTIDGALRSGVVVEFWTPASSPFGSMKIAESAPSLAASVGAPDGGQMNYTVGGTNQQDEHLPEGTYEVRVNDPRYQAVTQSFTVTGGQATRLDFDLVPLPGTITGIVRELKPDNTPGDFIANATVTVTANPGGNVVATVSTDQNGRYTTAQLAGGLYDIQATAFGYQPGGTQVFVENNVTAPTILLQRVPPSRISGTIRSSVDGAFIGGVTVEVLPQNGGPAVATAQSNDTGSGNPVVNYEVFTDRFGTFVLRVSKPGWKPLTRTITVNPQQSQTQNFVLDPRHVFGAGLHLVSLPDDFRGQDAASVMGIPSNQFRSAYWLPDSRRYAIYPDRDAAEFRLGRAMFVRFARPTAFTNSGAQADPDEDVNISVRPGWNMIGSVRERRVEWLRVKVMSPDGTIRTMQQAYDDGIIQNGLWGYSDRYYLSDYMEPFAGYFMRAFQAVTLIVPPANGMADAGLTGNRTARLPQVDSPLPGSPAAAAVRSRSTTATAVRRTFPGAAATAAASLSGSRNPGRRRPSSRTPGHRALAAQPKQNETRPARTRLL